MHGHCLAHLPGQGEQTKNPGDFRPSVPFANAGMDAFARLGRQWPGWPCFGFFQDRMRAWRLDPANSGVQRLDQRAPPPASDHVFKEFTQEWTPKPPHIVRPLKIWTCPAVNRNRFWPWHFCVRPPWRPFFPHGFLVLVQDPGAHFSVESRLRSHILPIFEKSDGMSWFYSF